MAALNKKVLLVDVDLRKKAISKELTPHSTLGLTNFLTDSKITDYKRFIVSEIQPNLDLFPSGPTTTHSAEILNTPKFTQFLTSVKETYDYVFLDDAPFLALPDSEIVANHSDLIVVVASCQKTKVYDLANMLDHFLQYGDKTVCLILNRTSSKNQLYYYYGESENSNTRLRAA